jgi:preprotein translocase subunit SecG
MIAYLMMSLLLIISFFLIVIVLLQRGRGGGLAGALGGMGGQSAFGTKAGDVFTRITIVLAVIWIVLCAGSIPLLRYLDRRFVAGTQAPDMITAPPSDKGKEFPDNVPENAAPDAVAPKDFPEEKEGQAAGALDAKSAKSSEGAETVPSEKSSAEEPGENSKPATPKQ